MKSPSTGARSTRIHVRSLWNVWFNTLSRKVELPIEPQPRVPKSLQKSLLIVGGKGVRVAKKMNGACGIRSAKILQVCLCIVFRTRLETLNPIKHPWSVHREKQNTEETQFFGIFDPHWTGFGPFDSPSDCVTQVPSCPTRRGLVQGREPVC